MRDRLIELVREAKFGYLGQDRDMPCKLLVEYITDHLLAAGVIVPPCKVGDTVYFVSRGNNIIPMIVDCISFNGNYQYCLTCSYVDEEEHGYSSLSFTDRVRGYMFGFTREEAERALEERREG